MPQSLLRLGWQRCVRELRAFDLAIPRASSNWNVDSIARLVAVVEASQSVEIWVTLGLDVVGVVQQVVRGLGSQGNGFSEGQQVLELSVLVLTLIILDLVSNPNISKLQVLQSGGIRNIRVEW